jgi:hypothetical protein
MTIRSSRFGAESAARVWDWVSVAHASFDCWQTNRYLVTSKLDGENALTQWNHSAEKRSDLPCPFRERELLLLAI